MDWVSIQPIVSGAIGGLFAIWLIRRWARFIPDAYKAKSAEQLLAEHRTSIRVANIFFFLVLLAGIYLFTSERVRSTSWPHFAIVAGLAIVVPVATVLLPAVGKDRTQAIEALTAFAIAERTPMSLLLGLIALGIVCLAAGLGALRDS